MAESTDGMVYADGAWFGDVGISLSEQDLKTGDYTSYSTSTDDIVQRALAYQQLDTTNLLSASNQSNKVKALEIEATMKAAELIHNSNLLVAKVLTNSARVQKASSMESNRINEASQILASEQYIVSTAIKDTLVKIETALKNQKIDINPGALNIDTSALTEANQVLASGVENQKATNAKLVEALAKQNEYYDFYNTGANALTAEKLQKENIKLEKQTDYYDFLTDGKDTLKDSNGNVIKPREVKAKKDAEQLIEQADTNGTTFNDIESYLSDALGILEDGVENIVGSTDGFDLNFNPFRFLDDILVSDYMTNKDDAVSKK